MSDKISVVITWYSDYELEPTVNSIRATSDGVEIVVVDDEGNCAQWFPNLAADRIIRNEYRLGVGPSRTRGVDAATNEDVLIIDSHCRFLPGWAPIAKERLAANPASIYSPVCLGLDKDHMDPAAPISRYHGAEWNLLGPDRQNASARQVFELVWTKAIPKDDAPIQGVMGGSYLVRKSWFQRIDALRFLRTYGCDEQLMSLKSWLCGGDTRICTAFGVGHRFLQTTVRPTGKVLYLERQPFSVPLGHITWNKLFGIHTMLPEVVAKRLAWELGTHTEAKEFAAGLAIFERDYHLVVAERARNREIFTTTFEGYCQRFGITL